MIFFFMQAIERVRARAREKEKDKEKKSTCNEPKCVNFILPMARCSFDLLTISWNRSLINKN